MKKMLLAVSLALVASAGLSFGQTPYAQPYTFSLELDGTGLGATNSGTLTLYAITDQADVLLPPGSAATISDSWTTASTAATPTFSLGTFVQGLGTLTLTGGDIQSFGGADPTNAAFYYGVTPIVDSPNAATTAFVTGTSTEIASGPQAGNYQTYEEGATINLLAGLAPGTYELDTYGSVYAAGDSFFYQNNNGANYGATFTVVAAPEPGTWALMLGGAALLVGFTSLRRRLGNSQL